MTTESWVVTGPQVIEVEDVRTLRALVVGGRVDIVARDEPGARIEVHSVDGRPLEISLRDGRLEIGYSFLSWDRLLERLRQLRWRDRAEVHIAVGRGVAVSLGTVGAEGLLAGVVADGVVNTVNGSLVVDGTSGLLAANTVSGEVAVRAHRGDLKLNTVSGDVAASGELTRVSVSTVSGSVSLDTTAPSSTVRVSAVSGDVTVRLPMDHGVGVRMKGVSGRVYVDGQRYKSSALGSAVDVRLGEGGCWVEMDSVSGDLTVLRQEASGS